jgi:hypothetical protein
MLEQKMPPKYFVWDTVYIPQKIIDIKLMTDIFWDYQEYIYNIDWIRYTETQVNKLNQQKNPKPEGMGEVDNSSTTI